MPRYTVEYEITIRGSMEVEASADDEAMDEFYSDFDRRPARFIDEAIQTGAMVEGSVESIEFIPDDKEDNSE